MEGRDSLIDRHPVRVLVLLAAGIAALWVFTGWVAYRLFGSWQDRAAFGDMFGVASALFSGLAFAGVIYAIFLQRRELQLQREELAMTREELRRSATAQERSEQALARQAETLLLTCQGRLKISHFRRLKIAHSLGGRA